MKLSLLTPVCEVKLSVSEEKSNTSLKIKYAHRMIAYTAAPSASAIQNPFALKAKRRFNLQLLSYSE